MSTIYSKMIFILYSSLLVSVSVATNPSEPLSFHHLPSVHETVYSQPGDINIGALIRVLSSLDNSTVVCSKKVNPVTPTLEMTEAVAFAINLVNSNPHLLPNVSLGFIMRGVCVSPNIALATSLSFLPRTERVCNGSVCSSRALKSTDSTWLNHDVIGLLSPGYSIQTKLISSLYAVAKIPLVGIGESSDEFSNKALHPYYFRLIPPDRYMVNAIARFIHSNGWTYISVLYNEGTYGQHAYENMIRYSDKYGICIASSHKLTFYTDYNKIVSDLLKFPRARVVVLFLGGSILKKIVKGVLHNNATGHFIFVGGDALNSYNGYDSIGSAKDPGMGTFVFDFYTAYINAFYEHIRRLRVKKTKNPWLISVYEYLLGCSYDEGTCKPDGDIFKSKRYRTYKTPALIIDAALTFAHAAHNLMSERCPDARGEAARVCITGELLREYLKKVDFEGFNGRVLFDKSQDVKARYFFGQLVYDHYAYPFTNRTQWKHMTRKNLGVFDTSTESFTYFDKPITWDHLNTLPRIVPWTNDSLPIDIPESVCSRPCVVGEYKIEKEVPCCWECLMCRDNERLVDGNTSCEACPTFTWPDPSTGFTTCIDISPSYPKLDDTIPIILTFLAVFSLIVTFFISTSYFINREKQVIKASSKELSVIQLVAIFVGYTTVILFQTTPTNAMCGSIFFLFCMSFALLYCPLLVKTVRIFRIFRSGVKNERPRFISPQSQMIVTTCLVAVQVTLCTAAYILFVPKARRTQPIWSEKMVELSCDLTFPGLVSFLGYNIVLVFLCSIFAFKVRSLPDNFNESKFISMCVSTTLLIWLAFVPTYFTADREYIRVFLLSMALLLNHSVALILLFTPKIYAAILIPADAGHFSNKRS